MLFIILNCTVRVQINTIAIPLYYNINSEEEKISVNKFKVQFGYLLTSQWIPVGYRELNYIVTNNYFVMQASTEHKDQAKQLEYLHCQYLHYHIYELQSYPSLEQEAEH